MTEQRTSNPTDSEPRGTFDCPVCGLDKPHWHASGSIRWYEQHVQHFKRLMDGLWPIGASRNYNPMGDSIQFNDQRVQEMWAFYQRTVTEPLLSTTNAEGRSHG